MDTSPSFASVHDLPLVHYAADPITEPLRFRPQESSPEYVSCYSKPRGLWLSVEDGSGWRDWCEGEQFALERLVARHVITLAPTCNVLWLRSGGEIDAFTQQYGELDTRGYSLAIRWAAVADEYQGLIIAPYQWSRRMDVSWYYGWDCSSGCIWNPAAIASVTPAPDHDG